MGESCSYPFCLYSVLNVFTCLGAVCSSACQTAALSRARAWHLIEGLSRSHHGDPVDFGPATAADPGEQHFLCASACMWHRHDKGTGNRNVPVKDMTCWRDKITLLSASICSVVVYAILGIAGLCYFQRAVNLLKAANKSKLFGWAFFCLFFFLLLHFLEWVKPGGPNAHTQLPGVPYWFRCLWQPNITFFAKTAR